MAKERVEFDVVGRDAGGSKAFKQVGDAAEKAADQVDDLGKASAKAGDETEKLGDKVKASGDKTDDAAGQYRGLAHEIEQVEGNVRRLASEIDRTGNKDLFKDLRKQQSELRKLTKAKDLLDVDRLGDEAAHGFAARFGARLGPVMASMPLEGAGAAGAALGVAMAPTLLAGLSGAVVGGAGIGGIVGGAILAARDPRVKAAGADLGEFILADLEQRAAGFVPVMLSGIDKVRAGWMDAGSDISRIFESSRLVDPLVDGMVSGGKKFIHGVADAVDKSEPVVAAFGRSFDAIGQSAGDFFTKLSGDADEGASAIDDLTASVSKFIETAGVIIHAGAAVKGWGNEVDVAIDKGRYWMEDSSGFADIFHRLGGQLDLTADGFKKGSKEAEAYRQATLGTATVADFATLKLAGKTDAEIAAADASGTYRGKIDEVNNALGRTGPAVQPAIEGVRSLKDILDGFANETVGLREANRGFEEAVDNATESVKRNGHALSDGTAKGRANQEALDGIFKATQRKSAATLKATGDQEQANAVTLAGRTAFLKAAAAMHMEAGKAQALADSLFGIPNITRTVKINVVTKYETHGSAQGEHHIGQGTLLKGLSSGGMVLGPGPKGVDSEPRMLAPGEGVLTAKEVDALGGPAGFEQLRAAVRGGRTALPATAAASRSGGARAGGGDAALAAQIGAEVRRALAALPIVRIDAGRTADIYSRTG
ncbi:hypothetical protein [Micromonospora sp. RTP1Z1]|uniref:hypothetical protein n=1 Tax=Micromonospora sp. RTP1Z1 TaxID=2994043 RepID=UPI0029C7AC09|nr:hypothetical protein [Micromonospora sp. RTP1Z1]